MTIFGWTPHFWKTICRRLVPVPFPHEYTVKQCRWCKRFRMEETHYLSGATTLVSDLSNDQAEMVLDSLKAAA